MSHFERAVALKPDLFEAYENLGQAYMATGDARSAILAAGRALELRDTVAGKIFFAQCLRYGRFTADNGRFRQLALRALSEGWTHPRELVAVCISLIALNGEIAACVARATRAWPARLAAAELFGASGLEALRAGRPAALPFAKRSAHRGRLRAAFGKHSLHVADRRRDRRCM